MLYVRNRGRGEKRSVNDAHALMLKLGYALAHPVRLTDQLNSAGRRVRVAVSNSAVDNDDGSSSKQHAVRVSILLS